MALITWEVTTDSKKEPVTVTELKDHLRVYHTNDDLEINSLIKSARKKLEELTGLAFYTQTRQLRLVRFPSGNKILLPGYKVQSITHVKYYDSDGTQQTWSNAEYSLKQSKPNWLQLDYDFDWPDHRSQRDEIEIQYIAGETATSAIDPRVSHCIKLDVELNYDSDMTRDRRESIIKTYDSLSSQLAIGEDFLDYGQ